MLKIYNSPHRNFQIHITFILFEKMSVDDKLKYNFVFLHVFNNCFSLNGCKTTNQESKYFISFEQKK